MQNYFYKDIYSTHLSHSNSLSIVDNLIQTRVTRVLEEKFLKEVSMKFF